MQFTPSATCSEDIKGNSAENHEHAHMEVVHDMLEQAGKHQFNEYWAGLRRGSLDPDGVAKKEALQ